MNREEIAKRAETYFAWPTDRRDTVTLTSCIFFAEWCAEEAQKEVTELRAALQVTIDCIDDISGYVSEYQKEKHGYYDDEKKMVGYRELLKRGEK